MLTTSVHGDVARRSGEAAIDPEGLVITMRSHWQSEAGGGAGGGGGGGEVVEDDGQAAVAVAMAAAREVPPGDE